MTQLNLPNILVASPQKGSVSNAIQQAGIAFGYSANLSRTPARNSKTTRRNHTWVIQKKEGGRWSTLRDSGGIINIRTRSMARTISREFNNTAKKPRTFRVKKLA